MDRRELPQVTDPEKKISIVDIFGEFGFRVVWSVLPHWADVKVYKICARGMDKAQTPMFYRKDYRSSDDVVLEIEQAEVYLEGNIKGDGCSELDQGRHHWCDEQDFILHAMLLNYLWQRAHQLMENSDFREKAQTQN
jgi:hypothetical protein